MKSLYWLLLTTFSLAVFNGCGDGPVQVVEPDSRPTPPVNIFDVGPTPSIPIALLHQNHDISTVAEAQLDRVKAMVNSTVQKNTLQNRTVIDVNNSAAKAIIAGNSTSDAATRASGSSSNITSTKSGAASSLPITTGAGAGAGSIDGASAGFTNVNEIGNDDGNAETPSNETKKPTVDPGIIEFANAARSTGGNANSALRTDGIDSSNAVREAGRFGAQNELSDTSKVQGKELNDNELEGYLQRNHNLDLFGIIHHRYRMIGLEWESDRASDDLRKAAASSGSGH